MVDQNQDSSGKTTGFRQTNCANNKANQKSRFSVQFGQWFVLPVLDDCTRNRYLSGPNVSGNQSIYCFNDLTIL